VAAWLARAGSARMTNLTSTCSLSRARTVNDEALIPTLWRVLDEMGNPRVLVDPRQRSRAWVQDRRAIDSFFLRDLDRDKVVLYGDP
jgi:hypothetical protein